MSSWKLPCRQTVSRWRCVTRMDRTQFGLMKRVNTFFLVMRYALCVMRYVIPFQSAMPQVINI